MDFEANGFIVDDVSDACLHTLYLSNFNFQLMYQLMVHPLPTGCRLTAIFDASFQK